MIFDKETGNRVSLYYHNINYPRVKIGAHETKLKLKNGLFVPEDIRTPIKSNHKSYIYSEKQMKIINKSKESVRMSKKRKKRRSSEVLLDRRKSPVTSRNSENYIIKENNRNRIRIVTKKIKNLLNYLKEIIK